MGNVTAKTSGEIASFMSPSKTNIKSLKVHFSPKQLGEGDPSPENVREIVGWDGVEVTHGINILDGLKLEYEEGSCIYPYGKGSVTTYSAIGAACKTFIDIEKYLGETIILNHRPTGNGGGWAFYNKDINDNGSNSAECYIDGISNNGISTQGEWEITIPNDKNIKYMRFTANPNYIDDVKIILKNKTITISYQWKLPDEYQEVEYIESTGTQYIKTNYTPQNFDSIKCLFSMSEFYTSGSTYWTLFSAGTGTYQLIVLLAKSGVSGAYYKYFASGIASKFNFNPNIDTKYEMNVDSNGIISCNDYTAQSNYQNAVDTPLYLMMRANGESPFKGKIYNFSIINNGINMINLVPCYRKSDGEIGMYDTVSQTFYTNQGTGTFLKGNDVDKTFYGGYIDLISGELVEEYYLKVFTGDENIQLGNWGVQSFLVNDYKQSTTPFITTNNLNDIYCNTLTPKISGFYGMEEGKITCVGSEGEGFKYVIWKDEIFGDTIESCKAKLKELYESGTPLIFSSKVAEVYQKHHQLTPIQLKSFIGQNNFWSNADYVEIEYELKETEDIQKARKKIILNQPHIESIKDNSISFNTDLRAPLKECKVYFEPVQEGEGDPSPENVRNITGWNRVEVKNGDNIYSIDWINDIGTVYGGYVDLVKGELVAEWSEKMINSFDWSYNSSGECFRASADIKRKSINAISPIQSKIYKTTKVYNSISYWSNVDDFSISEHTGVNSQGELINSIHIKDSRYTTVSDFLNGVGNESVIYELETPIHYFLTPQQILSLKGINNFSCGIKNDLSVRYWNYKKSNSSNIAYEAKNLTFDGTNYIDTGVYLFSEKNINRDFEVVVEGINGSDTVASSGTIICAKYNGKSYGFLVRLNGASYINYNGTISLKMNYDNSLIVRRVNGVISISGDKITNPKVKFTNTVFNHPLVLGCAVDDDGTYYRYGHGTIQHIVVRWL